jgi:hypothetical protein
MPQPTVATTMSDFLNGLPRYSLELAHGNASSPQAKALDWLEKDPLRDRYPGVYRLNQRYALAVLYYSTNGTAWSENDGWLSNDNECSWYSHDVYQEHGMCDGDSRLSTLDLVAFSLQGSIPAELELLAGLQRLRLWDDTLSGTIPSEL